MSVNVHVTERWPRNLMVMDSSPIPKAAQFFFQTLYIHVYICMLFDFHVRHTYIYIVHNTIQCVYMYSTFEFLSGSSLMSMAISTMGGKGTPRGVGFIWSLSGEHCTMRCRCGREGWWAESATAE